MTQGPGQANSKKTKKNPKPTDWSTIVSEISQHHEAFLKAFQETAASAVSLDDPLNLRGTFLEITKKAMSDPTQVANAQKELMQTQFELFQKAVTKFMSDDDKEVESTKDKRFKDPAWDNNFVFNLIKESYLATATWLKDTVRDMDDLDPQTHKKLDFYTRQFVDAMAPTNFFMTNPEVLRETYETKGENLKKGLENLREDFERGNGKLRIKTTDYDHFKVGENIAATPGKVIYRNDLIELIQYSPSTEKVDEVPILIVPPWINKFFIFDLSEKKSFVKWLVDQGKTVCIVSWINPDAEFAHKGFRDYMHEGIIDAVQAIKKSMNVSQVNVVGYCIGGTLLTCALSYLKAKGDNSIKSGTLLTTMIDFTDAGDLSIFIDDNQLKYLDAEIDKKGFLDAESMNRTYSLLRANDMIWSFVINNYMLGKEPFPFDLLYWNDDSTHLPAKMMKFFLSNMYNKNNLAKNKLVFDDIKIDLNRIDSPLYFMAAKEDHIAPWETCYRGINCLNTKMRFTLAASGHVAGMLNHPGLSKYHYWTNDELPKKSSTWLKNAEQHPGSWWPDWLKWIAKQGGKKVPARDPAKGKLKPLEDAPGSYVKIKMY